MIRLQQLTNTFSRKLREMQWSIIITSIFCLPTYVLQIKYLILILYLDKHYRQATHYPVEFLNSQPACGLPAHTIKLKVGVPIMHLRNLSPPKWYNETRLNVISLHRHTIEAKILMVEVVFIPHNFPFQFKRVQFPVSVCMAMTINKSKGQTLSAADVNFRTSCLLLGQLYVACSRVTSPDSLYILALGSITTIVMWWPSGKGSDSVVAK
ncbi:hypothetical protein PYW08_003129 [Mythimna loreyi]|uniref:Uncharacterized protein n=1 Tax=Mythimna loreyi TaxID=667449 RepID=A0ACC2QQ88_9NEOP|nr:hypothetical protein PYW08_003129 [Mythimna loreyi]